MNREGAETYLRLLAETELRGPMMPARRQPWSGPGGSTARLTAVAQALTAVRAIDPEIVEDILADFDLAVSVRQPADRPRSGPVAFRRAWYRHDRAELGRRSRHHHLDRVRVGRQRRRQAQYEHARVGAAREVVGRSRHVPVSGGILQPPQEPGTPAGFESLDRLWQAARGHVQKALAPRRAQRGQRESRPVDVRQARAERREHVRAGSDQERGRAGGARLALRDDAGPRAGEAGGRRGSDPVSDHAEFPAQGCQVAGCRAVRGDRARVRKHRGDLGQVQLPEWSRPVPGLPQDAFGRRGQQPFGRGQARAYFDRGARGRREFRAPGIKVQPQEQARPVGDQVEPPGAGRHRGKRAEHTLPGGRSAVAVKFEPVLTPAVIGGPDLVVWKMLDPRPGHLQVRARPVLRPVHPDRRDDRGF